MRRPASLHSLLKRLGKQRLLVAGTIFVFGVIGLVLIATSHAATIVVPSEAEAGAIAGNAKIVADTAASNGSKVSFGTSNTGGGTGTAPTAAKPCGVMTAPNTYKHVVWIWEENKDAADVNGSAPYIDSLASLCGSATKVEDNATDPSLPSEPAYAAATSGSNCDSGGNCLTDDSDNRSLTSTSIFQLAKNTGGSWKSYQESMSGSCRTSSSGSYAFKHNPAAFYSPIRSDCASFDISIPTLSCSNTSCGTPSGAFVDDINAGTLPSFAFVTPNLDNDMHDGSVQQGDSWLKAYLPLLFNGPNYKNGDTAVFVMWDEGSSNGAGVQTIPMIIAAPSVPAGTQVSTATNNIGILKTTQEMLGLTPLLGCAAGGNGCNANSSVSIRTAMHL